MLLNRIALTSKRVATTSARLGKIAALAECLSEMNPNELEVGVAYLSGELPQGRIGVGWAALHDAWPERSRAEAELALLEVHRELDRIASIRGRGSNAERLRALRGLLERATAEEQELLRGLLRGELRQGALEGVMVEGVARASGVAAAAVRRALMLSGDLGAVARAARERGAAGLSGFRLELFRPLQPMLAQTASDVGEALAKLGEGSLEWKLDGARVQAHRDGGEIRIYTRKLHDITARVPEVVSAVAALPVRSIVLDGEAIALRGDGRPQPFQVTMRRLGRRLDVEQMKRELPLDVFFFDCLHLDGEDLLDRSASDRFTAHAGVVPVELRVPRLVLPAPSDAEEFLEQALSRGHEGLMAKSLAATYEAGRRGAGWLKVKPAHSLDLVVLAVEWGSGRRQGWLSNLHLGARDPSTGSFVMLGKTFKGLTDELLTWQTERFQELELSRDAHTVYVRPEQVVEIAFDGVQESPHYPGGMALRFARVKRYRNDKSAGEADTIDTVRAIHSGTRR